MEEKYLLKKIDLIKFQNDVNIVRIGKVSTFHIHKKENNKVQRILSIDIWFYPNSSPNNILLFVRDTGGFMSMVDKKYSYKYETFDKFKKGFEKNLIKKYNLN